MSRWTVGFLIAVLASGCSPQTSQMSGSTLASDAPQVREAAPRTMGDSLPDPGIPTTADGIVRESLVGLFDGDLHDDFGVVIVDSNGVYRVSADPAQTFVSVTVIPELPPLAQPALSERLPTVRDGLVIYEAMVDGRRVEVFAGLDGALGVRDDSDVVMRSPGGAVFVADQLEGEQLRWGVRSGIQLCGSGTTT